MRLKRGYKLSYKKKRTVNGEETTPRHEMTELYHLQNITDYLKIIIWIGVVIGVLVLGIFVRLLT